MVTFSAERPRVRMFYVWDFEERMNAWWNRLDYSEFRTRNSRTLEGNLPQSEPSCLRGLETWSEAKTKQRKKAIEDAIQFVMKELEKSNDGEKDYFAVAEKYRKYTSSARQKAKGLALQDEQDVLADLYEEYSDQDSDSGSEELFESKLKDRAYARYQRKGKRRKVFKSAFSSFRVLTGKTTGTAAA